MHNSRGRRGHLQHVENFPDVFSKRNSSAPYSTPRSGGLGNNETSLGAVALICRDPTNYSYSSLRDENSLRNPMKRVHRAGSQ